MKIRHVLFVAILFLLHPTLTEAIFGTAFKNLFRRFFCRVGFRCRKCKKCHPNATCKITGSSSSAYTCTCNSGFIGDGKVNCTDINECIGDGATNGNPCAEHATCSNTEGSYECTCQIGYEGDGKTCVDKDECASANPCAEHATCTNTEGSYKCTCQPGYDGDGKTCVYTIKNECASDNQCAEHATCTNIEGTYKCTCQPGYDGDGKNCVDRDECAKDSPCGNHAACANTDGSFDCKCNEGFFGEPPSIPCVEVAPFAVTLTQPSALTYNPLDGQLCFTLINATFDANANAKITLNGNPFIQSPFYIETNTTLCTPNVTFLEGKNDVVLGTFTSYGASVVLSESFWCGSHVISVNLVTAAGGVYTASASVTATLADNSLVNATKTTTGSTGSVGFENLPSRTIIFTALGAGNDAGSTGANPGISNVITIKLLGFNIPSDINNNDFAVGLLGWETASANGVSIVPHEENVGPQNKTQRQLLVNSEDSDLVVSTGGMTNSSVVSRTFTTKPGVMGVLVRYRFVTTEFPEFFGSQFNDYFDVSIRSLRENITVSEARSMNDLGEFAFDTLGSTAWREAFLPINLDEDVVQVDITVQNVGDGAVDSYVYVDFVEETHRAPQFKNYDVVVVGGGTGGVAAAIEAARMGRTVALLDETGWLGGQMSAAGVSGMDEGAEKLESGFYYEFLQKMNDTYNGKTTSGCLFGSTHCFEPISIRKVLDTWVDEENENGLKIDRYFHTRVYDTRAEHSQRVTGVLGIQKLDGKVTPYFFNALITIDATETGDLLELGVERGLNLTYRIGKHVISKPSDVESIKDCVQDITYVAVIKNYTKTPDELNIVDKIPKEYDYGNEGFQQFWKGKKWEDFINYRFMPHISSSVDNGGIAHTAINWPNDYKIFADNLRRINRTDTWCQAKLLTLNFICHMQINQSHPEWSVADDQEYNSTFDATECPGIPLFLKDLERHMPVMAYVREGRRVVGITTVTGKQIYREKEANCALCPARARENFTHALAVGDYDADVHGCDADSDFEIDSLNETAIDRPSITNIELKFRRGSFQVPFEAFIPKFLDGMLVAEKNIAVSRIANGAIREQPITMLTGQAVGAIAALSIEEKIQPRYLNPLRVQHHLLGLKRPCRLALQSFTDVNREFDDKTKNECWPDVQLVAARSIMVGYNNLTFGSNDNLLRAQAAAIVVKTFNLTLSSKPATNTFCDVPQGHMFYDAVEILAGNGVVAGYAGTPPCKCTNNIGNKPLFCPDSPMTRAEFATFLVMGAKINPTNVIGSHTYDDVKSTDWFFGTVQIATDLGWMNGCDDCAKQCECVKTNAINKFCPNNPVLRLSAAHGIAAALVSTN